MPEDQPIFEVREISHAQGEAVQVLHTFRIWADGRIEGFATSAGNAQIVINRIPAHTAAAWRRYLETTR